MFTGIIRHLGRLQDIRRNEGGMRLTVSAPGLFGASKAGDSLAVNGVCLTVLLADQDTVEFELGPETLRKTTFADAANGQAVHLEWPLRLGETLDGHMVQGHVDGAGTVTAVKKDGDTVWMTLSLPKELSDLTVLKGSIAIDGVSLTVAEKAGDHISIMLMPYTVDQTIFSRLEVGQTVNVETDMLARHVAQLVKAFIPANV